MKAIELIRDFEDFYKRKVPYVANAANENGMDCSGAFVVAFKRHGQSIAHGSNSIARQYVSGPIVSASQAKPGYAVFKWREANDDMPSKYRWDGLGDFYHIGLLGSDGVSVYNAKGADYGFCIDPLSKWKFAAPLKGVDYGYKEEESMSDVSLFTAKVVLNSGYLNVRDAPNGATVGKLFSSDQVNVYEIDGNWCRIGAKQWVSSLYLVKEHVPSGTQTASNRIVIVDSEGNKFVPVGSFTVNVEDSID